MLLLYLNYICNVILRYSSYEHGTTKISPVSGTAGLSHSPIVSSLWGMRMKDIVPPNLVYEEAVIVTRTPSESFTKVTLEFHNNIALQENYQNPWGYARHGMLMEDLE